MAVVPASRRGVCAALGWLERPELQWLVAALLASATPAHRAIAVTACAMPCILRLRSMTMMAPLAGS